MIPGFDHRKLADCRIAVGILAVAVCGRAAIAADPVIRVYPSRVTLDGAADRQRVRRSSRRRNDCLGVRVPSPA